MAGAKATRIDIDQDAASRALGRAMGLAYMVSGAAENASDAGALHVKNGLLHIGGLIKEARGALKDGPQTVLQVIDQAYAACYVTAKDCVVELGDGDAGMHWNEEITAWAMNAICEAIKSAKETVDSMEVHHG